MEQAAYLGPGALIESDDPAVIAFAQEQAGEGDDITRAVRLYHAVRDQILETFRGLYNSVFLGIEGDFQAEAGA